jgi:hypothetical protein
MSSKSFGSKAPAVPHLLVGTGGLSGEVQDLRRDVEEAFVSQETPGHGGTSVIAVDEWTAPLAANAAYVLAAGAITAVATTITTLTNATLPHARNLTITCDVTGTGEGNIVVHGTDVNGAVLSETFAIGAADGVLTGNKAFKTVTSVVLPAKTVGMTDLAITIGSGDKLGLGSKAKLRNGVVAKIAEMTDGVVGGAAGAATAVNTGLVLCGHASFTNPKAAELVSVVADVLIAAGELTVLPAGLDYPRKLQVRITDANSSISAGTVTLLGRAIDGTAVTQVIQLTGGTRTVVTDAVYASLTTATVAALAGNGVGDNVGIGVGAELGLPIPAGATSVAVFKTCVDSANEVVAGVDATARAVAPTTAANAVHDYDFWFSYVVTPVQSSHTHPGSVGTLATPAVGVPNGTFLPNTVANASHNYAVVYERDLT